MPYLYCKEHGKDRRDKLAKKPRDAWEGEAALIYKGKLITGPWLCDSCNKQLARRDTAYLFQYLSANADWDLHHYDFAAEKEYFKVALKNIELVGWNLDDFIDNLEQNLLSAQYIEEEENGYDNEEAA